MVFLDKAAESEEEDEASARKRGPDQTATTEIMDKDVRKVPNQSSSSSGSAGKGVNDRKRKAQKEDVQRTWSESTALDEEGLR